MSEQKCIVKMKAIKFVALKSPSLRESIKRIWMDEIGTINLDFCPPSLNEDGDKVLVLGNNYRHEVAFDAMMYVELSDLEALKKKHMELETRIKDTQSGIKAKALPAEEAE